MKNKRAIVMLILTICLFTLTSIVFADTSLAKVTIYGKVTDSDGVTPCANAPVIIKLDRDGAYFPWNEKEVSTDSDGNYTADFSLPKIVQIYCAVETLIDDSLPFKGGYNRIGFFNQPPDDNGSYELNIDLKSYSNSAIIQGYLEDTHTGIPLNNYSIELKTNSESGRSALKTNSKGFYKELITAADADTTFTLSVNHFAEQEVAYLPQTKEITMNAGNTYTLNFQLERDTEQSYVYGVVT